MGGDRASLVDASLEAVGAGVNWSNLQAAPNTSQPYVLGHVAVDDSRQGGRAVALYERTTSASHCLGDGVCAGTEHEWSAGRRHAQRK